jgi:hypothetical protein
LTCPELDPYREQIKGIGVKTLQYDEELSPLTEYDWVHKRPIAWFVELIRYLSNPKFIRSDLRELQMVPISHDESDGMRLASAKVEVIYFRYDAENNHVLANAPKWLLQFAPIAFLDTEFLRLIEQEDDGEALQDWLRRTLLIRDFSIEQYCVDILSKLEKEYRAIDLTKLVTVTGFVVRYSGQELDWEKLPLVLHDERVMLLRDVKRLTFYLAHKGWPYPYKIQSIVVPENYDTECGWQHIWQTDQDRRHFIWLSEIYTRECVNLLVERKIITKFPLPIRHELRICPQTVTEVRIDYLPPSTANIRSQAMLAWINSRHDEKTTWPPQTTSWDFRGPRFEIEWACRRVYYEQDGFPYRVRTGRYQFKCEESAFLQWLRTTAWLPSSRGVVSPSQCFLPKPGIMDVFGDSVPYCEGDLPENIIQLLQIRADVSSDELIDLLRENSGKTHVNSDFVTRIYRQLNARPLSQSIKSRFDSEALFFVTGRDGSPRWCKKDECVWEDASSVLGDGFAYLSNHYPKLQAFFVEQLGVKRSVDKESYARRWLQLQEEPVGKIDERRKVVERLYQEMSSVVRTSSPRPSWWSDFSRDAKIYTQSDKFVAPKSAVLPDDGELRDIFRDSGVEYAWRPEKDAFSDWEPFYVALGTPVLSASVEQQIVGSIDYKALPANRFVTPAAIQMISAWLREKRKDKFQSLIEGNVFQELIHLQEAEISSEIQVLFRLKVGWPQPSPTVTYPVFWDRSRKVLLYGQDPDKSIIAKTIAKGLLAGQVDKDLAHWIELVLGASDTNRLKHENWSVPKQILDLFSAPRSTPVPSPKEIDVVPGAEPLLTPALSINSVAPQTALTSDHDDLEEFGALSIDIQSHSEEHGLTSTMGKALPRIDGASKSVQSVQSRYTPKPKFRHQDGITSASEISDGGEGDSVTESLLYADALTAAFNQQGKTRFEDDDMTPPVSGVSIVKNPQRRAQKLAEEMRHNINHEPSIEDRRYTTERNILEAPNEQVRMALLEWYNGKCQICGETWPKRDGEPYFAAAYLVERQHARWLDDPGNALCLCAKHFAQWRHAAKTAPLDIIEQIQSLRLRSEGGNGDLSILFTLVNDDVAIRYDERHFLALRTLLEVASEHPSATSVAPVGEVNYAD